MSKLTVEAIQKVLWGMSDVMRASLEATDGAFKITGLWAVKMVLDNSNYFGISDVGDWRTILAPGEDVSKRLETVIQSIEQQIPHLSGVFSEMNLPRLDFKILYRLVQELDSADMMYAGLENPDPLDGTVASAADAWFERIVEIGGIGEFYSPKQISELSARLLRIANGSVYDGTTGSAGTLIEAAREAKRNGASETQLFGQEINPQFWQIAQINLILHGLPTAHVARGDVLKAPRWAESERRLMRFPYVMMSPPFALRFPNKDLFEADPFGRYQYGIPSAAFSDMAFVQHAIASLDDSGKAALVQAHGALFRSGADEIIRKGILEDGLVEAVIFLPRNLLKNTGIPVAMLVLNKQNPHPDHVLFIKADEEFQPGRIQNVLRPEDIEKICEVYSNTKEIQGYSRLVRVGEIAQNDWNLNYNRYFDTAIVESKAGRVQVSIQAFLNSSTRKVRLSEIADVERGFGAPKGSEVDEADATHRLVNLSDIGDDGIDTETTTPIGGDLRKLRSYELRPGDVIISSRGTALKAAVVPDTEHRLVASANFNVIRLRGRFDSEFIKVFLESPVGRQQLQANQRGSMVPVISHKDLAEILVPNIPIDSQVDIVQASKEAEERYRKTLEEANRMYERQYRNVYEMMGLNEAITSEER